MGGPADPPVVGSTPTGSDIYITHVFLICLPGAWGPAGVMARRPNFSIFLFNKTNYAFLKNLMLTVGGILTRRQFRPESSLRLPESGGRKKSNLCLP